MDKPRSKEVFGGLSTGGEDGRISLDKETSSRCVGRLKNPTRDRALKVLAAHEKRIVDSPVEVAVVVFLDGEVYEYTGMKSRVHPPTGEVMKGAYVTHNHPKDSTHEWTFSDVDLKYFQNEKLDVLRGVDEKCTFQLDRIDKTRDAGEDMPITEIDQSGKDARHIQMIEEAKK